MALTFGANATDRSSHASVVMGTAGTVAYWFYATDSAARQVLGGSTVSDRQTTLRADTTPERTEGFIQRATTYLYTSAEVANFAAWGYNKWVFWLFRFNTAGVDGDQDLFVGDIDSAPAEPSAYQAGAQQIGTGAVESDAASAWLIGNRSALDLVFKGNIAWAGAWSRYLSNAEVARLWYETRYGGLALAQDPNCELWTPVGLYGVFAPDWSGNARNGTITGATHSPHAPLILPGFKYDPQMLLGASLVTLLPTGIASTLALGTAKLIMTMLPPSITSTLVMGTPTLVWLLQPDSIVSTLGMGTPQLSMGLSPSSIASTLGFGTHSLLFTIKPGSIASSLILGTPSILSTLQPSSIASTLAIGTHSLLFTIMPDDIASTLVMGTPSILSTLQSTGIASTLAFGTHKLVLTVKPNGIASTLGLGTAKIITVLQPSSIASTFTSGTPKLILILKPDGIASTLGFGDTRVISGILISLYPVGIASTLRFGNAYLVEQQFCITDWTELDVVGPSDFIENLQAPAPPASGPFAGSHDWTV